MQSHYPEQFERDMACTEAEWLRLLPRAIGDHPWQRDGATVQVQFEGGSLTLRWQPLPPRVIALMRMPRMQMNFAFSGLDAARRYRFMKRFDLYTQRGGG